MTYCLHQVEILYVSKKKYHSVVVEILMIVPWLIVIY